MRVPVDDSVTHAALVVLKATRAGSRAVITAPWPGPNLRTYEKAACTRQARYQVSVCNNFVIDGYTLFLLF